MIELNPALKLTIHYQYRTDLPMCKITNSVTDNTKFNILNWVFSITDINSIHSCFISACKPNILITKLQ